MEFSFAMSSLEIEFGLRRSFWIPVGFSLGLQQGLNADSSRRCSSSKVILLVYNCSAHTDNRLSYRADIILMLNRGNRRLTVSPFMVGIRLTMLTIVLGQYR